MKEKVTLVLGASENTERYSNRAIRTLLRNNIPVVAVGLKKGYVNGVEIQDRFPQVANVDTVTIYLNPQNQVRYYDYILSLKPKRIIFNPGAENTELKQLAQKAGIEALNACTLTMLAIGTY